MRATRALVAKELGQHGAALLGVTALLLLAWAAAGVTFARESRTLSELQRLSSFLRGPLLIGLLFLGHRLVVSDLFARTQRFLEGLPLRRWHPVVVKLVLGQLLVLAWGLGALALAALAAQEREPLPARFLGLLTARVVVYCFCLWSVAFLFGCFGRVRVFLTLLVAVVLTVIDRVSTFELSRFGPMALTDPERLPFERATVPVGDMLEAGVVGLGCLALGLALQWVREGGVAESLARRMSPREWSALFVVAIVSLYTLNAVERQQPAEPYQPTTDLVWKAPGSPVRISYVREDLAPAAERLGRQLDATLGAMSAALALSPATPVDVVHGPEVRPRRIRLVGGDARAGLVVRANLELLNEGEQGPDTVADVLHAVLSVRTRGRARREPVHWFLDGFVMHLAAHPVGPAPPVQAGVSMDILLLRGLQAAPPGFDVGTLRAYHPLSERLGDSGTMAFAATGVRVLESRIGRARLLELARAVLGRAPQGHLRDYLHSLRRPLWAEMERIAGLDMAAFVPLWAREIDRWRGLPQLKQALLTEPRLTAQLVTGAATSSRQQQLRLQLRWQPPGRAPQVCTVLHQKLEPRAVHVDEDAHEEQSFTIEGSEVTSTSADGGQSAQLERDFPAGYGSGERAFLALECESPVLGVPQRLLGTRVTVP